MIEATIQKIRSIPILRSKPACIGFVVALLILLTYGESLKFQFVWDDINFNIVGNPHINQKESSRFSPFWQKSYAKLYIPLTYTAWYLQAKLSRTLFPKYQPEDSLNTTDLNPAVFHAFNVIFHTINALLVALLTFRLFPQRGYLLALIAAALYAIHPLQIEVVAWITGFKDLLSTFFILLALIAWLHYRHTDKISSYGFSVIFFASALLSKPSAIILPFLLLAIDCLHLKIPIKKSLQSTERLFYVSILWIVFTKILQPDEQAYFTTPLWFRPFIALDAFCFYIQKTLFPFPLCIDYGRNPQYILEQPWVGFTAFIPILIFLLILKIQSPVARQQSITLHALTFIALAPTLGFIPFEYQSRYSTVADRYAHLALIPISIAISSLAIKLIAHKQKLYAPVIFTIIICLAGLTHHHAKRWENNLRLNEADLKINPQSQHLQINYTVSYSSKYPDQVANVLPNAIASIQIQHDFYEGLNTLGVIYSKMDRHNLALRYLQRAEFVRPDLDKPLRNIAFVLYSLKRYQESLPYFERYLKMSPHDWDMLEKLAQTHYILKNWPQALKYYQQLSQLQPGNGQAFVGLGASAINSREYKIALQASQQALRLLPSSYDALINLATALIALDQHAEAIPHLERAAIIQSQNPRPHILLATAYHHLNSQKEKLHHIQTAQTLAKDNPEPHILESIQSLLNAPATPKTK